MSFQLKNLACRRLVVGLFVLATVAAASVEEVVAQVRPGSEPQVIEKTVTSAPRPSRRGRVTLTAATRVPPAKSIQQVVDETIQEEAAKYRIDPLLIYVLMYQESRFKPGAVSPKGARGLMQLMPGTARRWGVKNPHDPREAIQGGTKYLVWLIDRFGGNVRLGLAGYNAGEGAVDKYNRNIPPYRETQDYVRKIEQKYLELKRSARGAAPSSPEAARQAPAAPEAAEAVPAAPPSHSYKFRVSTNSTGHSVVAPGVAGGQQ